MKEFRWSDSNREHIAEHGIDPASAEWVVNHPGRGYPRREAKGKFRVWGQDSLGRYLQVIWIVDPFPLVYIIHARPLTESEKRVFGRGRRP